MRSLWLSSFCSWSLLRRASICGCLAGFVLGCRPPRQSMDKEPRVRAAVESALRAERAKGIFIDTTKTAQLTRNLPLMIFSPAQLERFKADTGWRWQASGDSSSYDLTSLYAVGVSDNSGQVIFGEPYMAAANTRLLSGLTPTIVGAATTLVRFEAVDTPDPKEFPASAIATSLRHARIYLVQYVENRLFDAAWPSRVDVQRAGDSTIVSLITKYLPEPVVSSENRQRQTAYMVSLASVRGQCTRVAIRWLTQSKGSRESSWVSLASDGSYEPSKRNRINAWFADLEPCTK